MSDFEKTNYEESFEDNYTDMSDSVIDRGIPNVSKKSSAKTGVTQKIGITVFAGTVILALVAVNGGFSSSDEDSRENNSQSQSLISNRLGATPAPPAPPASKEVKEDKTEANESHIVSTSMLPPPALRGSSANTNSQAMTPAQRKRSGGFSGITSSGGSSSITPTVSTDLVSNDSNQTQEADGLAAKLSVSKLSGSTASIIRDRSFFITKGSMIDCSLDTAISSDQPGGLACIVSRDVYSTDLKVKLIDAGSIVTGRYQGGLMRGQARIFAIWERIETPHGVIIDIDSPASDALGRGGIGGYIDTHFSERFGGAILLSIIGDIGRYASNQARSGDNNQIQFGGTADSMQDAASIALENSINIPNTLYANQGDHVGIYVARDLDFRGVYKLKAID